MQAANKTVFLREYTEALRDGHAAMFVGAGVSRSAGFVDWKQLLKHIALDLGLDVDREADLVTLAQFHHNDRGARDRLNQMIVNEFVEHTELTNSHKLIATLPINTIWTTNYDDLIERSFEDVKKRTDVKRRSTDFSTVRKRADVVIYKMHGDKSDPPEAVLTKEDYETYNSKRELFTIALKGDLAMKTFLFLGVSFSDPNLNLLLDRVRQLVNKNGRQHYCLLKQPRPGDHEGAEYECKRFPHHIKELGRYNIQPVLIDDYSDVPETLTELNRRCRLRNIFVSGSAADFSPMGEQRVKTLCETLGQELIKRGYNLISGFGLGIGGDVIVGAMRFLGRNDDERLMLRPFPQEIDPAKRAAFWTEYRQRMLADAGVCVVIAGNKQVDGNVQAATGVNEEVEIARKLGRKIIPIGATGHIAKHIWDEMKNDIKATYGGDVSSSYETIGNPDAKAEKIVNAVMDIIQTLNH